MTQRYALVLTGEVLRGFKPASVWPKLADLTHVAPDKLAQIVARAPLAIKHSDDLDKLKDRQASIRRIGAQAEICPADDRPTLRVLLAGTPRGPVPRAFVEQRIQQGVWANSIAVGESGATMWKPYWKLATDAAAAPPSSRYSAPASWERAAEQQQPNSALPPDGAILDGALPPGAAIHAGFWRRYAAFTLDWLISFIFLILLSCLPFIGWLLAGIGMWLYFAWMESSTWQATLGKRVMGIKVVDANGYPIGFGRATGRYFGKIPSGFILYIGFMMAGWTERKQALHDKLAGTCVVFRDVEPDQPLPTQRPPMPWYGWALNVGVPVIGFLLGITANLYMIHWMRVAGILH